MTDERDKRNMGSGNSESGELDESAERKKSSEDTEGSEDNGSSEGSEGSGSKGSSEGSGGEARGEQESQEEEPGSKRCRTEAELRSLFSNAADVNVQTVRYGTANEAKVVLAFSEGMCDSTEIGRMVLHELDRVYEREGAFFQQNGDFSGLLPIMQVSDATGDMLTEMVFQGSLLLLFEREGVVCAVDISHKPTRMPMDSTTEISVKGPRDCFVEDVVINVALIRKRLRTTSLHVEYVTTGRRSRTQIGLLYIYDILNPKILKEVRDRLERIDVDAIYSISQVEEMLTSSKFKILPLMDFTGRPDFAVNSLLSGRIVIIIDGLPMVLIAPAGLSLILKSPEDAHFNYAYVSFARIIRGISLFLSIFLPAIWVALTAFHPDQIPFRLMATISLTRLGLPFSAPMEMFLLLALLEIFREAGVRLPSSIGQTLTSIGALIIGDAAIRAGLVSPSVVVVGAITAVSGVTLVNQTLSTQVSILRLFFFLLATFLGMYGVILGIVLLVGYMASLKSFGVSYFAPLSPPQLRDIVVSFLRVPWAFMRKRPAALNVTDPDHQGDSQ